MRYFVTPTHCVAANRRVATTATARAIVETFYPGLMAGVNDLLPAEERFADPHVFKALVPTTEAPDKPVLLLVRDPVDRFLSALSLTGKGVFEALADGEVMAHEHFLPQSRVMFDKAFRLADQAGAFCEEAGLPPLPRVNAGGPKPQTTLAERRAVRKRYAADAELYDSLA